MKKLLVPFLLLFTSLFCTAQVVINELLAISDSIGGITDEYGEYDDWVELYNNGGSTVDLSGYFISDDSTLPMKWMIPSGTTIAGSGYLIIWTDKDENNGQVPLHTNFKLSGAGETVLLSGTSGAYVDSIAFGPQVANKSFARVPNGTGDFEEWPMSFGENNNTVSNLNEAQENLFSIYPNPVTSEFTLEFEVLPTMNINYEIIDISGRTFDQGQINNRKENIDVNNLANGAYFIRVSVGKNTILRPFQKL